MDLLKNGTFYLLFTAAEIKMKSGSEKKSGVGRNVCVLKLGGMEKGEKVKQF